MGFWGWLITIVIILAIVGAMVQGWNEGSAQLEQGRANGISGSDLANYGALNTQLICPHCQTKGRVLTKMVSRKAGISGAKATGALLTGGVSLLATGLSRKETLTQAHCVCCKSTWHF